MWCWGILSPGFEMWPLWGSSDLVGYTERYLSAFSTPAVWNVATRIFCQSDREAGMKRNPLGMADMSAGFHGAVLVVHITWHLCLWGMPRTYSSMLHTLSPRYLKDNSFLESSFGNDSLNVGIQTVFLCSCISDFTRREDSGIYHTETEVLTAPFGFE